MNRAMEITRVNHTATRVRRAAQVACSGMERNHRSNCDLYRFTDGSSIAVSGLKVTTQEASA